MRPGERNAAEAEARVSDWASLPPADRELLIQALHTGVVTLPRSGGLLVDAGDDAFPALRRDGTTACRLLRDVTLHRPS